MNYNTKVFVPMLMVFVLMATSVYAQPIDITINRPQNTTYTTAQNVPVNVTFNETVNATWSLLNGVDQGLGDTNVTEVTGTISSLGVGYYNFTVYANDSSGNLYSDSQFFTVDIVRTGISGTLNDAGAGLGGFLTAITDPTVSIVLALGIIGGILAVFYGISLVIKRAMSGVTEKIGG